MLIRPTSKDLGRINAGENLSRSLFAGRGGTNRDKNTHEGDATTVLRPDMSGGRRRAAKQKWEDEVPESSRRHVTRNVRSEYVQALAVANAAQQIESLPEPGTSLHCIMRGNWHMWDLVPAVLDLAGCKIRDLYVATLGFNDDTAANMLQMIDDGNVERVRMLCSVYFRDANKGGVYEYLVDELAARGSRILAMRNHAKIIGIELADGRRFVVETSANLRSCRNVEQFSLSHDPGLFAFHAEWIDTILDAGDVHK